MIGLHRLIDLLHAGLHRRIGVVEHRIHQQLPQRATGEQLAEHIEHLVAEGLAGVVEFLQQLDIDLALAGVLRQQVPEVADLLLTNSVDASEALLQPVGVPGQVVVHHQVRPLQVHALARSVVGQQHHHLGVIHKGMHHLAAFVPWYTAMDLHHRFFPAEAVADLAGQVGERVLELGEQHQLSPAAVLIHHQRVIEDPVQLHPLGIGAGIHHPLAEHLQLLEDLDLVLQLRQGLG